jgi:hypothetical protein
MKISKIEHFQGNGFLIIKLALSFGPTPARRTKFPVCLSFFMAFGAVGFGGLGKGLLAIVADPAVFVLPVGLFGHLQVLLLHGKNLGVAVRALGFVRAHMDFVAEGNRVRSFGGELDLPSPNLLRLGESNSQGDEINNANANDRDFPNFHTRTFPPFPKRIRKYLPS